MPKLLDPRLDVLPPTQRAVWPNLRPLRDMGLVLYGGTAVALHLGHRQSVDFDFFAAEPLDKVNVRTALAPLGAASILFEDRRSLVLSLDDAGAVKVSLYGGFSFGRIDDPLPTRDGVALVASIDDLLATKLKTLLDRAEGKDYRDIAAMLGAGGVLARGLAGARTMFGAEPRTILLALGYFEDGDVGLLSSAEKSVLLRARDEVADLPEVQLIPGTLAVPIALDEE